MNKLHNIEISRIKWRLTVWTPIILGTIIFSIFNYLVQQNLTTGMDIIFLWLASVGFLLVGWGFGLAYARMFKIRGIDE